eukprot:sb/3471627/
MRFFKMLILTLLTLLTFINKIRKSLAIGPVKPPGPTGSRPGGFNPALAWDLTAPCGSGACSGPSHEVFQTLPILVPDWLNWSVHWIYCCSDWLFSCFGRFLAPKYYRFTYQMHIARKGQMVQVWNMSLMVFNSKRDRKKLYCYISDFRTSHHRFTQKRSSFYYGFAVQKCRNTDFVAVHI